MKVLQLGKYYAPISGGVETVTYDITECLNNHEIRTDVLCSNNKNEYKEDTIKGYKVFRAKSLGVFFSTSITPSIIYKLKKIFSNYDILHVHLPNPMINLALFVVNPNKKIVLHWHSDIVKQKYLLKLYAPLERWLLNKADKIIVTSDKYMEESVTLQPFRHKCVPIPIGIDKEKLGYEDSEVLIIKEKYKNKKIIFSLGRLIYYKGFNHLIDAAQYLDDSYVILIAGDGELRENFKNKIERENLNKKVYLLGRIEDKELGNYYKACDIFCLPSIAKSEAFGVVQLEAMSFAKPIVATKIQGSGVDWVNEDGISGINVPVKDAKAISDACKNLLKNDVLYQKFSNNAMKRFNEMFQRDTMVKKVIELYENLTKKGLEFQDD